MRANTIFKFLISLLFLILFTGCTNQNNNPQEIQENYQGRYYLYEDGVVNFDKWYELEETLWRNFEGTNGTISNQKNQLVLASSSDSFTVTVQHNFLKINKEIYMHENNPFFPAITFQTNEGSPISKKKFNVDVEPLSSKPGFDFDGWYLNPELIGERITFPYIVTKDIKFYAKWKLHEYKVSFFDGDKHIETQHYTYGTNIIRPGSPYKLNYSFAGWYKDSSCTQPWNFFYEIVTSDMMLYAKWTPFYFVESVDDVIINGIIPYHQMSKLIFPQEINGKKVKSISSSAFNNNTFITEVIMPDSIETIGNGAFRNCINLERIQFSNNLKSIGSNAFEQCKKLKTMSIPDTVTTMGASAFTMCSNLESLTIGSGLRSIKEASFRYCTNLKSVNFNDSLELLESFSFADCPNLDNINLLEGLNIIESYAFSRCTNLKNITIPDTVILISDGAFAYCTSLSNIILPPNLETIPQQLFSGCTSLQELVIPGKIKNLRYGFIANCDLITSITIPASVITITEGAFSSCNNLSLIYVDQNSQYYQSYEGVLYDKNMINLLVCPMGRTGDYIMPDTITSVSRYAFNMCNSLNKVVFSNKVSIIPDSLFNSLTGLTSVILPEGLRIIYSLSFNKCNNIKSIIIPASVTSIYFNAFSNWNSNQIINVVGKTSLPFNWDEGCFSNATIKWDYKG